MIRQLAFRYVSLFALCMALCMVTGMLFGRLDNPILPPQNLLRDLFGLGFIQAGVVALILEQLVLLRSLRGYPVRVEVSFKGVPKP